MEQITILLEGESPTLIFTENELLHWCLTKIRSYLSLKRLGKVLKFRISCF